MNWRAITFFKLRIVMGLIFLWAFIDKTFGLGFSTVSEKAWINGGSPTTGFLLNSTRGPFVEFFRGLAGVNFVDWLFMLGLLFVGATLLFNRLLVWGVVAGTALLLLMYLAAFPPTSNPFLDYHIVYILVLFALLARSRERR